MLKSKHFVLFISLLVSVFTITGCAASDDSEAVPADNDVSVPEVKTNDVATQKRVLKYGPIDCFYDCGDMLGWRPGAAAACNRTCGTTI